jgi:hypothetical protein
LKKIQKQKKPTAEKETKRRSTTRKATVIGGGMGKKDNKAEGMWKLEKWRLGKVDNNIRPA